MAAAQIGFCRVGALYGVKLGKRKMVFKVGLTFGLSVASMKQSEIEGYSDSICISFIEARLAHFSGFKSGASVLLVVEFTNSSSLIRCSCRRKILIGEDDKNSDSAFIVVIPVQYSAAKLYK